MSRRLHVALATASLFLASTALASAAYVTADLNLRSGPGTGYRAVGVIPAGEEIDVLNCSGAWCEVEWDGRGGFVSASYIRDDAPPRQVYVNPPVYVEPPVSFYYDSVPYYWDPGARYYYYQRGGRRYRAPDNVIRGRNPPRPDYDRPRPGRPDYNRPGRPDFVRPAPPMRGNPNLVPPAERHAPMRTIQQGQPGPFRGNPGAAQRVEPQRAAPQPQQQRNLRGNPDLVPPSERHAPMRTLGN